MQEITFIAVCALAVVFAIVAVTRENPIYTALYVAASMGAVAVDFLLLHSPFLAAMQVLLYAGAIMVLFVFVIMLLSLRKEELGHEHGGGRKVFAAIAAAAVFVLLAAPAWTYTGRDGGMSAPAPVGEARHANADQFGATETFNALYDDNLVAFELVSVLLLSALAGVVILAKKKFPPAPPAAEPEKRHDHTVVPELHPPTGPLVGAGAGVSEPKASSPRAAGDMK